MRHADSSRHGFSGRRRRQPRAGAARRDLHRVAVDASLELIIRRLAWPISEFFGQTMRAFSTEWRVIYMKIWSCKQLISSSWKKTADGFSVNDVRRWGYTLTM